MSTTTPLIAPAEIDAEALLQGILAWVEMETPSDAPEQVNALQDRIAAALEAEPGVRVERVPGRDGRGDHVVARYNPANANEPPILVMGHIDTVWPVGTLAARPIRREGDRVFGPGIFDMKAGSYLAFHALTYLARRGLVPPRPVVVLFNADEEVGSPTSRGLIERLAREAACVLVAEPATGAEEGVVTARKGWGRFRVTAEGRPAHAGGNHAEGRSAIREIARQILDLEAMTDYARGTTVNVGVVQGGTLLNVVPAQASIEVDLRAPDAAELARMSETITGLRPHDPEVRLTVEGGINRPPFVRSPQIGRLYDAVAALGRDLGVALPETARGGVSDGNFAAALGRPTLDGLGCGGEGAHALHEHIRVSSIAPRAALMINLLGSEYLGDLAEGGA